MNALVDRLVRLQKEFASVYNNPVIGIQDGWVHIDERQMEKIAPLNKWDLNIDRKTEYCPFEHHITIQGVLFLAITDHPIILPDDHQAEAKADADNRRMLQELRQGLY